MGGVSRHGGDVRADQPRAALNCLSYLPMLLLCAGISFLPKLSLPGRRFAAPILMALCLAALAAQGYEPFVYFQF